MKTRWMIGLSAAFFGLYLGLAAPAAGKTAAAGLSGRQRAGRTDLRGQV
jgi:hypothetical protein